MTRFATEALGLVPAVDEPDVAVYRLVDGDEFQIFGPDNDDLPYYEHPIAAFLVEEVESARAEMESKGVEFLGPTEWHNGSAWTYFRAPDGNVYELTHRTTSEGTNA